MNDEPKEFAFGDLNPVAVRRTAPKFDPKNASVMDAIREVILGYYTPDAMAGTGPYKGIVLRVEEDMDPNEPAPGNWLATVFGEQGMFEGLTQPKIEFFIFRDVRYFLSVFPPPRHGPCLAFICRPGQ